MQLHWIDIVIMVAYFLGVLGIGYYFMKKNVDEEDFYVGGRTMGSFQIGFSTVATDVGGGFSIGLGGVGFLMGISGSWLLFTGFIGALLSAAFLIPKIKALSTVEKFYTLPEVFGFFYDKKTAFLAGIISALGYAGFTSSQMMAGAKLAAASFPESLEFGLQLNLLFFTIDTPIEYALLIMAVIIIAYTAMGGLKAVIYTDVVQWIILLVGLIFIGIPLAYLWVGGMEAITQAVSNDFLNPFQNITWQQFVNWFVTIIPIWFIAMTLYQRIYACRSKKEAKRAWYISAVLEWPCMAFMGTVLGLLGRVAAYHGMFDLALPGLEGEAAVQEMDPEMGLPLLMRSAFPIGLTGIMLAAYFSAIMSTADSCLVASSGNLLSDILNKIFDFKGRNYMRISQIVTLGIGVAAVFFALAVGKNVLDLMLYPYAFLASSLLVPVIGALYWNKSSTAGAFWSMLLGGSLTVFLTILKSYEVINMPLGLDPIIYGIIVALIIFVVLSHLFPKQEKPKQSLNQ